MIAEILSTGDEIRTGAVVDSNAAFIAQRLEESGIWVQQHRCVGDERHEIAEQLMSIGKRADIAIVTGGLGPTDDDVTAEAAALAAEGKLVLRQDALDMVRGYFQKRGRPFSNANRKQAFLPDTARLMANPIGTAPGFILKIGQCRCYFLPGVPSEMRQMMAAHVLPEIIRLEGREDQIPIRVTNISTFGLPESIVAEKLHGFEDRFPQLKLGLRTVFPEIHVKLYPDVNQSNALERIIPDAVDWVNRRLDKAVLSTRGESMPAVVGSLLRKKKATVALAESCTGGLIAHMLTGEPGSSDYFVFSAVTYANQAKIEVLGVSPETLLNSGAVHEDTALQMAAGARRLADADYGLSTSGIAGPSGGTPDKPVGTVCVGLADRSGARSRRFQINFDDRAMNKRMFAVTALDQLRKTLAFGIDPLE